jgi:Ca2+-binding EF-hand superfamily protein
MRLARSLAVRQDVADQPPNFSGRRRRRVAALAAIAAILGLFGAFDLSHPGLLSLARGTVLGVGGAAGPVLLPLPPEIHGRAYYLRLLMRFDADEDGVLTRTELEAGLRREFDAVDRNGDSVLDAGEIRAADARRRAAGGTAGAGTTWPPIDWNNDGSIDFNEFARVSRALFEQLDVAGKGAITLAAPRAVLTMRPSAAPP